MKSVKIVRMLKNNPKYLCKYLILTNIFILLYFVICSDTVDTENSVDSTQSFVTSDQSEKLALNRINSGGDKPFKFHNFELNTWRESQRFNLRDSSEKYFVNFGVQSDDVILFSKKVFWFFLLISNLWISRFWLIVPGSVLTLCAELFVRKAVHLKHSIMAERINPTQAFHF